MAEQHVRFACVLNCMDGRSIAAVDAWMKEKYGVHFVDQPTKEGIVKTLAENTADDEIEKLKYRAEISVTKHGAKVIAVAGHEHCAGNPVTLEEHREHVREAVRQVTTWGFGVPVVGLFAELKESELGNEWKIKVVVE